MLLIQTKTPRQIPEPTWTWADTLAALNEPRLAVRYTGWTEQDTEMLRRELASQS